MSSLTQAQVIIRERISIDPAAPPVPVPTAIGNREWFNDDYCWMFHVNPNIPADGFTGDSYHEWRWLMFGDVGYVYDLWTDLSFASDVTFTEGAEFIEVFDAQTGALVGTSGLPARQYRFRLKEPHASSDRVSVTYGLTYFGMTDFVHTVFIRPVFTLLPLVQTAEIFTGESTVIQIDAVNACQKDPPLPASVHYTALITGGDAFGQLLNTATGDTGTVITNITHNRGLTNSLSFVANGEKPTEEKTVTVKIEATYPLVPPRTTEITVKPSETELDNFVVEFEKDTVVFTETSKIFVQAKDAGDNNMEPPADMPVNIVLRTEERYGNLAYRGGVGKAITDVPYADAKSGQVLFAATGENPIGLEPQQVEIGVTGSGKEGTGRMWIKASIEKFCQNDSLWRDQDYDSYKELDAKGNIKKPERQFTIGEKGCALTAMAMVLKAVGKNYNPSILNDSMTVDGLFTKHKTTGIWSGGVDWRAVTDYANDKIGGVHPIGEEDNWKKKQPIPLSELNPHLQKSHFVVALVGNPDKKNPTILRNHWVLVTGTKDNQYQILDPGCYSGRQTLDSYANNIYRAIIYQKKGS